MLKATPPLEAENKICELAAKAGISITQFLNPYLVLIANGQIKLVPQVGPADTAAPTK